jgi:hypothetical protein
MVVRREAIGFAACIIWVAGSGIEARDLPLHGIMVLALEGVIMVT